MWWQAGADIGSKKHSRDLDNEDLVLDLTDQTADAASNWRMRKKKKAGAGTMGALLPSSSSSVRVYKKIELLYICMHISNPYFVLMERMGCMHICMYVGTYVFVHVYL